MVYFQEINNPIPPPLPEFEFDEAKSLANLEKHGIDFEAAKAIWLDPNRTETPARTGYEARVLTIGVIDDRHWTAVITYREAAVRIISVRRSRPEEIGIYERE
jgi:hypothetical protein